MGRGSLTLGELYNGLVNQFELVPSQDEIELFFLRYDKDRDGRLRFTEYCNAFIPLDGHFAAMLNSRKSYHRSDFIASVQP
jgi:Ca2+-binding EF-hand superfamily protein